MESERELVVPAGAQGLVAFAHGSGSSRHSPRNNFVAERLRERGLGTLLFDLLTEREDRDRGNRFDIPLLTDRLVAASRWLRDRPETGSLSLGYFGSSTGAVAVLRGAARRPDEVLALNREAADQLRYEHALEVVEGAGHLFEGPGELEAVADLAAEWFGTQLG